MQRFIPWTPVGNIPQRIHCEAIHDDVEGLRILLRGESPTSSTLRIRFEYVIGYLNTNESYRLKTWEDLGTTRESPLLIVENSRWLEWLQAEAPGVIDVEKTVHYAIFASEDCIDVASEIPPAVDWLSSDE